MEFYVRPIRISDAPAINEMRRMPGVMENILGVPSERVKGTEAFLEGLGGNDHMFVAVARDENAKETVAGCIGLTVAAGPRKRHSGTLGIMVHHHFQGMGVGQKLMETVLDLADNWLMLIRVELSVFVDNERAIALYREHGFEVEGTLRKAAVRNGEFVDEFVMARVR